MLSPLPITKLYFPPARPDLVRRPRLCKRLTDGLTRQLTLLSAPAGYGKTTLLSEWRASDTGRDFDVAWLSLSSDDNDTLQFVTCLATALASLHPGFLEPVLAALHSVPPPPLKPILSALINNLSPIAVPYALVLDDYHVITSQAVHEVVSFVLDHLPAKMHLVLLTRADPPLPLARLRARDQLAEIRSRDLQFTAGEALEFLRKIAGPNLSSADASAIQTRTEGWVAGLQLATLAMQGREDLHSFVSNFHGSHHYIVDFLVEEVLARQAETVRDFLIRTSVLHRMTAPLCNAITGRRDSQQQLQELENQNLFVIPLDETRQWYRYHHLFAEVLHVRLGQPGSEEIRAVQRRASDWCAAQGLVPEAIAYALEAQDHGKAADLAEANAWSFVNQGNAPTVLNWIAALPDAQLSTRPDLEVVRFWALFITGKEDQMMQSLQKVEAWTGAHESGEETLLRAVAARWRGQAGQSRQLINAALEQLPESRQLLHGQAYFNLGMLYRETDIVEAEKAFRRAAAISEAQHDIQAAIKASYHQGTMLNLQGAGREAASAFQHALALAREQWLSNGAGFARLGMAQLYYEWNDLPESASFLEAAIQLAQEGAMDQLLFDCSLAKARLHRARAEWDEAQGLLDQAKQLASQALDCARGRFHSHLDIPVLHEQVSLWLRQGNLDPPMAALDLNLPTDGLPLLYRQARQATLARVLIFWRRYADALAVLKEALQEAERAGVAAISIRVLQAMAHFGAGDMHPTLACIQDALTKAEPEGYVRVFLDEGKPVLGILRLAASKGIAPAYVRRLVTGGEPIGPVTNPSQALIEPLSKRELEVLGLIAEGLSNRDIAARFVLSVGTVKAHTASIYRKLDVTSRTQAVARARKLQLL